MKQKGQALVEFIIILPIFILLLLGTIDLGNILFKKYQLESDMDTIIHLYKQNRTEEILEYKQKKNTEVLYVEDNTYTTILLSQKVSIVTPGLNLIFPNPYIIEIKRVVYHE